MEEIVDVERVIFKDVTDEELYTINSIKNKNSVRKYFRKMKISAVVILVLVVFHLAGLVLKDNSISQALDNPKLIWEHVPGCLVLAFFAFVIYNIVSLFYTFVKRQLVVMTENYFILLEAKVSDKYLGKKLAVEGKERKKRYVVFSCDQGVCSKAVEVTKKQYNNIKVGDPLVVVKSVTVDGYEMKCLKEDEYRKIYNRFIKNA